MANSVFKSIPVYYNGKKVAEIASHSVSLDGGDEEMFGQEGFLGWSDGIIMMTIEAQLVVPVQGITVPMLGDMIAKKYVTLGIPVEGKLLQADMRCTNIKYDSDSKAGSTKMGATFKGPQPTVS